MHIKIVMRNVERLGKTLGRVQQGCVCNLLELNDFFTAAEEAEQRLNTLGIPRELKLGFIYVYGNKKYPLKKPVGTIIEIERGRQGWFLKKCFRTDCDGQNKLREGDYRQKRMVDVALLKRVREEFII